MTETIRLVLSVTPSVREGFDRMAVDYGLHDRNALVAFLAKMHSEGLLVVMNKAAKECLVGAAEEKVLKLAKRAAAETTRHCLWEEGYRADPYEH